MSIDLRGDETEDSIEAIARGKTDELFATATEGTPEQIDNAIEIIKRISIYSLGSIVFNESIRSADHDPKRVSQFMLAHLDNIKEQITTEVDCMVEGLLSGDVEWKPAKKEN